MRETAARQMLKEWLEARGFVVDHGPPVDFYARRGQVRIMIQVKGRQKDAAAYRNAFFDGLGRLTAILWDGRFDKRHYYRGLALTEGYENLIKLYHRSTPWKIGFLVLRNGEVRSCGDKHLSIRNLAAPRHRRVKQKVGEPIGDSHAELVALLDSRGIRLPCRITRQIGDHVLCEGSITREGIVVALEGSDHVFGSLSDAATKAEAALGGSGRQNGWIYWHFMKKRGMSYVLDDLRPH